RLASLCASSLSHPPPLSPLFPYTTLFRSFLLQGAGQGFGVRVGVADQQAAPAAAHALRLRLFDAVLGQVRLQALVGGRLAALQRSEEHTSELQSRENLVCRLLLEKKNTTH